MPEPPVVREVRDRSLSQGRAAELTTYGNQPRRLEVGPGCDVEVFPEGVLEDPLGSAAGTAEVADGYRITRIRVNEVECRPEGSLPIPDETRSRSGKTLSQGVDHYRRQAVFEDGSLVRGDGTSLPLTEGGAHLAKVGLEPSQPCRKEGHEVDAVGEFHDLGTPQGRGEAVEYGGLD